jgi:hypothetical protein
VWLITARDARFPLLSTLNSFLLEKQQSIRKEPLKKNIWVKEKAQVCLSCAFKSSKIIV